MYGLRDRLEAPHLWPGRTGVAAEAAALEHARAAKAKAEASAPELEALSKEAAADALFAKHMNLLLAALMQVATFSICAMWVRRWASYCANIAT